jgi:hypothetical protein
MKRADTEAVAKQDQPVLAPVPQGSGKLAAQAVDQLFSMFLPQVREELGVRVVWDAMAKTLQIRTQLVGVEQSAVKDGKNVTSLIGSGTGAVLSRGRRPHLPPDHSQTWLLP